MALRVTIGGTAETDQVLFETISIVETVAAGGPVSTASFTISDPTAAESFTPKQAVVIDDDGGSIVYFKGEIAGALEREEIAPGKLMWYIECQDYNQLLAETVVTSYTAMSAINASSSV